MPFNDLVLRLTVATVLLFASIAAPGEDATSGRIPAYRRDMLRAALSVRINASQASTLAVTGSVGNVGLAQLRFPVEKGKGYDVTLPFRPWRLRAGRHAWKVTMMNPDGAVVRRATGALDILPRLRPGDYDPLPTLSAESAAPHKIALWKSLKTLATNRLGSACAGFNAPSGKATNEVERTRLERYVSTKLLPAARILRGLALTNDLAVCAEAEGEPVYSFVKACASARYILVLNDADRPRPISVRFPSNPSAAVYDAIGARRLPLQPRDGHIAFTTRFHAADAVLLAIFEEPPAKLTVDQINDGLDIALCEAIGRFSPGRQIISLEIRDPHGTVHDESGFYEMTNGRLRVPFFLADDEFTAEGEHWTVRVRDLTTGLEGTSGFYR